MPANKEWEAARLYHSHSCYFKGRPPDLMPDEDQRPFRFRTYPGSQRVELPGRDFELDVTLGTVLQARRSIREFRLNPLDLARVGRLLHASYGVRGYHNAGGEWFCDRPCPSAGALYPVELYVATQAVTGLPDGLYHYDARAHQLEVRRVGLVHPDLAGTLVAQDTVHTIRESNLVIVLSAIFQRTMWKYGERGYRYIWLDAGHLGQNLYLVSTALGLGPVSIGGFFDEELKRLLTLTRGEEEVIYLFCIGQPRET